MSYLISFQSQLSSVMEILVKAAVTEASKTVEGIFADFQIEIDKHIKENENLKRKILGSATEKELEYVHGTESMEDHASKYRSVGIQVDCRAIVCAEAQDCCWRKINRTSNLVASDQWNHHCSCNTAPAERRPVYFTVERAEAVSRPIKVESLDPNQLSIDLEPQEELRSRGKRAEESTVLLHDRLPIGQQPSEEEWTPSLSQPAQLSPAQVLNNDSQDEQKSDVHHGLGLGHTVLSMHTITEAGCHDQLDFGVISEQASTWDGGPIPAVHTAEGEMPNRSGFNVEGRFLEQDKTTICHELQWPCVGKSLADIEGNAVQQLYCEEDTGERCHREEEDDFQSGEQKLNITANLVQLKKDLKSFSSTADGPLHCPELQLVPSYGYVSPASAENTGLGGSAYNYNQCRECGKNFRTQRTLKTHLRIHARERTYECSVCGRSFCNLDHLRTHQLVHTRQKPFVCSLCGKSFGLLGNLKTHQRIHTGEKPYSCPECGRSFSHQQNLDTHLRIHTGEKPYSCTHCGKNFSILQNLKTHIRIHTGEKPYSCTLCGKCFTQLSNLRTHQRTRACERPQTKY